MREVVCRSSGPPENLTLEEVADPQPGAGQVSIDVYGSGLNFPDTLQIAGKYQFQPPFPFTPGAEISGVVSGVTLGDSLGKARTNGHVLLHLAASIEQALRSQSPAQYVHERQNEEAVSYRYNHNTMWFDE